MFLSKPTAGAIEAFLASQAKLDFSYKAIGATSKTPPAGYVVDHTRIQLGHGEAVFAAAKTALVQWRQFQLGWVQAISDDTLIREGEVVAVLARSFGIWWLNPCRIISVVDEAVSSGSRFGFSYGTLPGHMCRGEERFLIERHHGDDSVWYDILAFSQPRHYLARLGYPLLRRVQRQFGKDSAGAMRRAVAEQIR